MAQVMVVWSVGRRVMQETEERERGERLEAAVPCGYAAMWHRQDARNLDAELHRSKIVNDVYSSSSCNRRQRRAETDGSRRYREE